MRRTALAIALLTLTAPLAWSDVTFHLYVNGTTDTSLAVAPGGTAELLVQLHADSGEQVAGASYDVQLPMEGWMLNDREYGVYGWYEYGPDDDESSIDYQWDGSVPTAKGTPVVILNGTYTGGDPDTADFWFNTARSPYPSSITGWATAEVFEIAVPHGTTPGTYSIDLANANAYDIEGAAFNASGQFFEFTVTPEPASTLLLLAGVAVLGARLRRRK